MTEHTAKNIVPCTLMVLDTWKACLTFYILAVSLRTTRFNIKKFYRAAAIQERVTGVLRSIPKEAFADSFPKLYKRCQPCSCEGWRVF
jgi:hypothetical protein